MIKELGTLTSFEKALGDIMLTIRTIVHPTDFSDSSNSAFQLACALARDHGARVIVAHVLPMARRGSSARLAERCKEVKDKLSQMQADHPNMRLQNRLLTGDPVDEICQLATETRCRLIVMGTHGRSGLNRLLMGSVAEQVIRRAPCPVLAVKTPLRIAHRKAAIAKRSVGAE